MRHNRCRQSRTCATIWGLQCPVVSDRDEESAARDAYAAVWRPGCGEGYPPTSGEGS